MFVVMQLMEVVLRLKMVGGWSVHNSPGPGLTVLNSKCKYISQVQNSIIPYISFNESDQEHDPTTFRYGVIPFLISVPGVDALSDFLMIFYHVRGL